MASIADIKACLGEAVAKYAANKHRGGSNGKKGTRYEDFFMAYRVAKEAAMQFSDPARPDPLVQGQVEGFVDDLRVASNSSTSYYQLKNQAVVSWTSGDHPIAVDFAYQLALSTHLGEPAPNTSLVVSSAQLADTLAAAVPDNIKGHSQVHHFPWTDSANKLLLEWPELRAQLTELSNTESPTDDALYATFCMLLMACIENPEGASACELLAMAAKIVPIQVRLLPPTEDWESRLDPTFRQVLDEIHGLVYAAKRGFFQWSGFGTSGIFRSSVLSEEFKQFQNDIVQHQPKTFEEFEGVLP